MFYFLIFSFALFFPFYFSSNLLPNEKCFDNFCFVIYGVSDQTCPSPYKSLEFPDNQTWESFKQVVKQNPFYSNKYFRLNLVYSRVGWEWMDGEKYDTKNGGGINNQTNVYPYNVETLKNVVCLKGSSFYAQHRSHKLKGWICQEEGCNEDDDSCYEVVDGGGNGKTWYEAMNDCVEKRKRLASFKNNQILQKVSTKINQPTNQVDGCYWIGLSRNNFKWKSSNQMVTFNNWTNGHPREITNPCPFVETSTFSWDSVNQNYCPHYNRQLMCMREKITTSTKVSTITFSITKNINNNTNNDGKSNNINDKNTSSQKTKIGLGVGLTIAILILLILFFLLLYFLHKRGKLESFKKKYKNNNNKRLTEEVSYSQALPVEKPIYAEVVEKKNDNKIDLTSNTSNLTYVNPKTLSIGE